MKKVLQPQAMFSCTEVQTVHTMIFKCGLFTYMGPLLTALKLNVKKIAFCILALFVFYIKQNIK